MTKHSVLITLFLAVSFEIFLGVFLPRSNFIYRLTRPLEDDELRFQHRLLKDAPAGSILLLGSSQAREDYDANLINSKLASVKVVNLGLSGGNFTDFYQLCEKLIAAKPVLVIYTTYIGDLTSSDEVKENRFSLPLWIELQKKMGDNLFSQIKSSRRELYHAVLAEILPSFGYRNDLLNMGRRVLKGDLKYEEFGAVSHDKNYFRELFTKPETRFALTSSVPEEKEAFILFLDKMQKAGIKVIVIDGPLYPGFETFIQPEAQKEYENLLKGAEDSGKIAAWLRKKDLPNFFPDDFADFTHLKESGRIRMSEFLAKKLRLRNY